MTLLSSPSPSPSEARQVRVFISSTFRDMHAERDHLVTVVFPELRERLERLGLEFFDVDLRWGVPAKDADGETANSWEYCRQWIDRVEPFFVCMLGQRYGWVPEPGKLKTEEDRQRQQEERRSITDMEIRHAVLTTRLKRRSYFYLRAREAPTTAAEYVDPPPLLEKLERLKSEVRTCGRPVWDYPCEWTGSGFAGMEEFGRRVLEDLWSGVLRDERYVGKEVWRQVLGTDPDNDPHYADEAIPVPRELWEKIVALAKPPPRDPLDAERQQMEAFAASRLRWFQGRTEELETLAGFIGSTGPDDARLAVVAAVPGQGKSALIAKLSTLNLQPSTFQITHFVGATERSASAHALVGRLLAELDRSGVEWPADEQKESEEPKQDFNSQCLRLAKRLGDYSGERRIVLLLDALNQLSDGHDLNWLPHRLGPSVRVVVSCVDDPAAKEDGPENKVLHALVSRRPAPLRVPLGPLTDEDVRVIVVAYLREYCKELDTPHVETICATPQARNPLYLLVMLGELRTLGGNEMNEVVPKLLASMVTDYPDTDALFQWVLQRLEVFGTEAVQWWCLYLAHGRVGMASHELADLLARKLGADATAIALLIERGLRRYLLRRGGQLDFFHGQLRQAVMEQYGLQAEPAAVHREMADYFTACAKGTDPQKEWETDSVRGYSECVFHLTKAGQHEQAAELLSNFPFLLHKLRVGLLEGVFEDYDMVQVGSDGPSRRFSSDLEIWSAFFREKAHILRRGNEEWPAHKILLQLAVEHADDSPLTIGAERWLADGHCDWIWFRRVPRPTLVVPDPCLRVFEGGNEEIRGVLIVTDGRLLSWSGMFGPTLRLWRIETGECLTTFGRHSNNVISSVISLKDGRLLSWSHDASLLLWDSQSGQCLATLKGHTAAVGGAIELENQLLLSWSADETLRVWDSQSGRCLTTLKGHSGPVTGALALSNERLLSWANDSTLRLWNRNSGECLKILEGHTHEVWGVIALANDQLISWSYDYTLRLWNTIEGRHLQILEGHTDLIHGIIDFGNNRLLSWSRDKTLRLWDSQNHACLLVLDGHRDEVWGGMVMADGRILSWSADRTLRIWNPENGACIVILTGHSDGVKGGLILPDGRVLSWSYDRTLRLWDGHSGECMGVFEGHTDSVVGALTLSNNLLLSWSKDGTLRMWNTQVGTHSSSLHSHTKEIGGVVMVTNSIVASWSDDATLRLWCQRTGICLAILEGHNDGVVGVLAIGDGRLASWSWDHTLRIWDGWTGRCLAILLGHSGGVVHAEIAPNGLLMSWSEDMTKRLWDCQTGKCLHVDHEAKRSGGPMANPEWTKALLEISMRDSEVEADGLQLNYMERGTVLRRALSQSTICVWNADTDAVSRCLLPDGTAIITQANGQVCFLKLHHGHRRITLAEAEAILVERGDLPDVSDQSIVL